MSQFEKTLNFCPYCGKTLGEKRVENKIRKFCSFCNRVIYDNPVPVVAGIIFNNEKILLIKRGIPPRRGFWSLPSGFIDRNENAGQALIREIKEETNLTIEKFSCIKTIAQKGLRYNTILIIGFIIYKYKGELLAGDDAVEASFFNLQNIPELAFSSHYELIKKGKKIYFHNEKT